MPAVPVTDRGEMFDVEEMMPASPPYRADEPAMNPGPHRDPVQSETTASLIDGHRLVGDERRKRHLLRSRPPRGGGRRPRRIRVTMQMPELAGIFQEFRR